MAKANARIQRLYIIFSKLGIKKGRKTRPRSEDHNDGGDNKNGGEDNNEDDEHQRQLPKMPKKYI
uniref:Uncharacterized protein n=1 Tax=Bionectria ochroleuca TaxID=29856 RepID=A0A0B7KC26_BIOOC